MICLTLPSFSHLQNIFHNDLKQINNIIKSSTIHTEHEICDMLNYLNKMQGKQIRSITSIIFARLFHCSDYLLYNMAASIEILHLATILHDDVIDNRNIRRNIPCTHKIWCNKTSILLGDYLFSKSFELMMNTKSMQAISLLLNTCSEMIKGEISQMTLLKNQTDIDIIKYLDVALAKTGKLFGTATELSAILSNKDSIICEKVKYLGERLGIIFQIIDDTIDYLGNEKITGKELGSDFYESKITFPIIILKDHLSNSELENIEKIFRNTKKTNKDFLWVVSMMNKYHIKNNINNYLKHYKNEFNKLIDNICKNITHNENNSLYLESMRTLFDLIIQQIK